MFKLLLFLSSILVTWGCVAIPIASYEALLCEDLETLTGCSVKYDTTSLMYAAKGSCIALQFGLRRNGSVYTSNIPIVTVTVNHPKVIFEPSLDYLGYDFQLLRYDDVSQCCCLLSTDCHKCHDSNINSYCADVSDQLPCIGFWGAPDWSSCFIGRDARSCGAFVGRSYFGPVYVNRLDSYYQSYNMSGTSGNIVNEFTITDDVLTVQINDQLTMVVLALPALPNIPLFANDQNLLVFNDIPFISSNANGLAENDPTKTGFYKFIDGAMVWDHAKLAAAVTIDIDNCKHGGVETIIDPITRYNTVLIDQNQAMFALEGQYLVSTISPYFSVESTGASVMQVTFQGDYQGVSFEASLADVKIVSAKSNGVCEILPRPAWVSYNLVNGSGIVIISANGTDIYTFFTDGTSSNETFPYPFNVSTVLCLHGTSISCMTIPVSCFHAHDVVVTTQGEEVSGGGSSGSVSKKTWVLIIIVVAVLLCLCCCVIVIFLVWRGSKSSASVNVVNAPSQIPLLPVSEATGTEERLQGRRSRHFSVDDE